MKLKRVVAYIIDIFIVSIITTLIMNLPMLNKIYDEYQKVATEYMETFMATGSSDLTEEEIIETTYNLQSASQSTNIITVGLLILYFGVAGYLCKGQTLGKKVMHLKIVSANNKELNPGLFILREILVTNILPRIALIIATTYLTSTSWYNFTSIIGYIEYLIIFLIIGFMIFRDDERGFHDLICNTKVISTSNKE